MLLQTCIQIYSHLISLCISSQTAIRNISAVIHQIHPLNISYGDRQKTSSTPKAQITTKNISEVGGQTLSIWHFTINFILL